LECGFGLECGVGIGFGFECGVGVGFGFCVGALPLLLMFFYPVG